MQKELLPSLGVTCLGLLLLFTVAYRSVKALALLAGLLPAIAAAQVPAMPMAGIAAGGTGLTPFYVLGFELGPWQDYLARELVSLRICPR